MRSHRSLMSLALISALTALGTQLPVAQEQQKPQPRKFTDERKRKAQEKRERKNAKRRKNHGSH